MARREDERTRHVRAPVARARPAQATNRDRPATSSRSRPATIASPVRSPPAPSVAPLGMIRLAPRPRGSPRAGGRRSRSSARCGTRTCAGESGLVHAATGTGKTLAAWFGPLLEWLDEQQPAPNAARPPRRARRDGRPAARPLDHAAARPRRRHRRRCAQPLQRLGIPWTLESRTGDTSAAMRARQATRLPTALDHHAGVAVAAAHARRRAASCSATLRSSSWTNGTS